MTIKKTSSQQDEFVFLLESGNLEKALYLIESGAIDRAQANTAINNYLNKKDSFLRDIYTSLTHSLHRRHQNPECL